MRATDDSLSDEDNFQLSEQINPYQFEPEVRSSDENEGATGDEEAPYEHRRQPGVRRLLAKICY